MSCTLRIVILASILAVFVTHQSQAASKSVAYSARPAWVIDAPAPTKTSAPDGAPIQFLYNDTQTRVGNGTDEFYSAYRVKILQPEGLAIGNMALNWNFSSGDIRIHGVKIIRDGREIDVLKTNKFSVIQREEDLANSMLNGVMTATLQIPGLQVGDEVEFASTTSMHDAVLGSRSQGMLQLPFIESTGAFRIRLTWPSTKSLEWKASSDLEVGQPQRRGEDYELTLEMRDPKAAIMADHAPDRVNVRRTLQYSSFKTWGEVSNVMAPLFEQAATLAQNSPIKEEAARIAASTSDPVEQAAAALKVVQQRIRYVFSAIEDGNYRPMSADEVWRLRFGDCKGKSALLVALLRELGIQADVALISVNNSGWLEEHLPMLAAFDHALVRASINNHVHWIDGTRVGDESIQLIPPPLFRWALPLHNDTTELEFVQPAAPTLPENSTVLEIDATGGFEKLAKVNIEEVIRGDEALSNKLTLERLSRADAERQLHSYWSKRYNWVTPDAVAWRYDAKQNLTTLTMTGQGTLDWKGDSRTARVLDVPNAGLSPPALFRRPFEQDQTAPWLTSFPRYRRWTTMIRLPAEQSGWKWGVRAKPMDTRVAGVAYWRDVEFTSNILRITMSSRTYKPEINAEEAAHSNREHSNFDNAISQVIYYPGSLESEINAVDAYEPLDLLVMAEYLEGQGKYDQALIFFEKAVKFDLTASDAILGKVRVLDALDKTQDAISFLKKNAKRIKTAPQYDMAHVRLLLKTNQKAEAFRVLDAAAKAHPTNSSVLVTYCANAKEMGQYDQALAAITAAIEATPDDALLYRIRAVLLGSNNKQAEAAADLEEAIKIQPEDIINIRNRSSTLRKAGKIEAALTDADEALRINPLDISSAATKAHALRQVGRHDEALTVLNRQVELTHSSEALIERCRYRGFANMELAQAQSDCTEAIKANSKSARLWETYGIVAFRSGKYDDAITYYNRALAIQQQRPSSLYGRGIAKLGKGDANGGQDDIQLATSLSSQAGIEFQEAGITPN